MWAIRNNRTKKWLYGTNFDRNGRPQQRTSSERVMTWDEYSSAEIEYQRRKCGKDYKIVPVKIEEVNREDRIC
jgi:hypothetical protein